MLSTFTTEPGRLLVIPSSDIRALIDQSNGETLLLWECCKEIRSDFVQGSAQENRLRLQQEELDAMGRIAAHQRAFSLPPQLPPMPVVRGKAAGKAAKR